MSFDKEMIRVYNYAPCSVGVPVSKDASVLVAGTDDPERPGMETFRLAEIEYINAHTKVFLTGALEFEEDEREEIYQTLRIRDWDKNCFFESGLDELLLSASLENMERVLAVKDVYTIDRIYAHMERLMASQRVDVSSRVQTVVRERRKELYEDILTSRIQLVAKEKEEAKEASVDVDALVAEKVAQALAQMQAPVVTAQASAEKAAAVSETPVKKTATAKKPAVKKTTAKKTEA